VAEEKVGRPCLNSLNTKKVKIEEVSTLDLIMNYYAQCTYYGLHCDLATVHYAYQLLFSHSSCNFEVFLKCLSCLLTKKKLKVLFFSESSLTPLITSFFCALGEIEVSRKEFVSRSSLSSRKFRLPCFLFLSFHSSKNRRSLGALVKSSKNILIKFPHRNTFLNSILNFRMFDLKVNRVYELRV
jgi:hypothetical protein